MTQLSGPLPTSQSAGSPPTASSAASTSAAVPASAGGADVGAAASGPGTATTNSDIASQMASITFAVLSWMGAPARASSRSMVCRATAMMTSSAVGSQSRASRRTSSKSDVARSIRSYRLIAAVVTGFTAGSGSAQIHTSHRGSVIPTGTSAKYRELTNSSTMPSGTATPSSGGW